MSIVNNLNLKIYLRAKIRQLIYKKYIYDPDLTHL